MGLSTTNKRSSIVSVPSACCIVCDASFYNHPSLFLRRVPLLPGVYQFFDHLHAIIYVGKARSLRKRLASYFKQGSLDPKTAALVKKIASIEWMITASENEALLLEYQLIKKHSPRYNILFRDDKSYPYICVSNHPFPRISVVRSMNVSSRTEGEYFGPYPYSQAVHHVVSWARTLFQLRPCRDAVFRSRKRPCLYYQLQQCSAPCCGLISVKDYAERVKEVRWLLSGKKQWLLRQLRQKMKQAAKDLQFEASARYRDLIAELQDIQCVGGLKNDEPEEKSKEQIVYNEKQEFSLRYGGENHPALAAAAAIQKKLGLSSLPRRIACFDVSHTAGTATVAASVVLDCEAQTFSEYRRYHLDAITPGDDYAALLEALKRRLNRWLGEARSQCPDIVLIDGGKGQLQVISKLLPSYPECTIAFLALAKGRLRSRESEYVLAFNAARRVGSLSLFLDERAMNLLRLVRDEAHRFALASHQARRSVLYRSSFLETIAGVGAKRRAQLLNYFGGWQEIKSASIADLEKVPGISKTLAKTIYQFMQDYKG